MDIQSTVSNTDAKLYANLMVPDEHKSTEQTMHELSRVTNGVPQYTSDPDAGSETLMDLMPEVNDDDLNDFHDDASISPSNQKQVPSATGPYNPSIQAGAMYDTNDFHDIDGQDENKNPTIRRQKQEILFQLLKEYPNEAKGQWTINVPLFELKYELKRRKTYETERDQIYFIKELLKMVIIGMEYGNKKLGNILELDGWAQSVTANMGQFDRCILALYRRYFKRKSMDPLVEFVWLLLGSMIMWHIQHKYLGASKTTGPSTNANISPPPSQFSFNSAGPSTSTMDLSNLFNLVKGM